MNPFIVSLLYDAIPVATSPLPAVSGFQFWFSTAVFFFTFVLVATEKIHKTTAVLLGAVLMLCVLLPGPGHKTSRKDHPAGEKTAVTAVDTPRLSPMDQAILEKYEKSDVFARYVNFDVIFTLAGMMVIVNILSKTGLFQYVAIKSVKFAGGRPVPSMVLLVIATAVLSAFLDNVTTILLVAPVSFVVASSMKMNPIPFLLAETMASNIGGTSTLIGDPPNLIIGSAVGLDFMAFLCNLAPFILFLLGVFCACLYFYYRKRMFVTVEQRAHIMEMNENSAITDASTLKRAGTVMSLTLVGFILHGFAGIQPCVIAMGGAALCLLVCKVNVEEIFEKLEWGTLFFFIGLFIVVEGATYSGLIGKVGMLFEFTRGWDPIFIILAVMWCCAAIVMVVNNVSFTAVVVSLVMVYLQSGSGMEAFGGNLPLQHLFWWGIALAVCLAGNFTAVGAAANLLSVGIAEQNGHKLSFVDFLKFGVPVSFGSMVLASAYIAVRYWLFRA
ncbi:MAG: Inner membrane protein YbiR [Lentisphaerae bacterium ADurb.Bin242]|nr:MAG: Inner membrane protein YbiR [Lentisphaerae bacterium ADurb.Bin242]